MEAGERLTTIRWRGNANRRTDRGLHTLAALLHGSIGQTDDDNGRQPVGVIHFDFNDNAFEPDQSTGKYARKHGASVDEEEGNVIDMF